MSDKSVHFYWSDSYIWLETDSFAKNKYSKMSEWRVLLDSISVIMHICQYLYLFSLTLLPHFFLMSSCTTSNQSDQLIILQAKRIIDNIAG